MIGAPNLDDLFSGSRRNQETNDGNRAAKTFTERAKDGKVPGVEIRRSDPATGHGRYLESLRVIAADPSLTRKRKCDLLALAQKNDQRGFGERACMDGIEEWLDVPGGPGGPVFFLSDDKAALAECAARFGDRVGRLNTGGFLAGLVRGGLAGHHGLKPDLEAMMRDLREHQGFAVSGAGLLIDNSRARADGNDGRFHRAVAAVAQERTAREWTGRAEGRAEPVAVASRADRFRQKWGNGYARGVRRARARPEGGGTPAMN